MARYEGALQHLSVAARFGDEVMARCPFHDDSNASMQVNVEKGLFICFACGAKGSMKRLERQLGVRIGEGEYAVADIKAKLRLLATPDTGQLEPLDEGYLDRYRFPCDYWTQDRGMTPATVEAFDLGYDPLGDFVTIPLRDVQGRLLGVIRRFLDPDAELRYRYPRGFKRASNLFASWMVEHDEEADHVVLVEGSVDAMKVWQAGYPAMACYGNSISPAQIRVLKRLGVTQVTLLGDNDRGGDDLVSCCLGWHPHRDRRGKVTRWDYRDATDLRKHGFLVRKALWSRAPKFKDPGAMDTRSIQLMLRKTRRVF